MKWVKQIEKWMINLGKGKNPEIWTVLLLAYLSNKNMTVRRIKYSIWWTE